VIGSSVSAPQFTQPQYSVTIPESMPRLTNFLNVTAESDPTGNFDKVLVARCSNSIQCTRYENFRVKG